MEAAVWVGLALLTPWIARRVGPGLAQRMNVGEADPAWWARAVHGILPMYLAWIRGAVPGRDLGLHLVWSPAFIGAAVVLLAVFLAAEIALRRSGGRPSPLDGLTERRNPEDLFDAPRLALYRGAGIVWTGSFVIGSVLAWLAGLVEDVIRTRRMPSLADRLDRSRLAWLTAAVVVLGSSGSLWLMLAAQAGLLWLARERGS